MSSVKYSLVKYHETNEYHLYESCENPAVGCVLKEKIPLCGDKNVSPEGKAVLFVCLDEKSSRTKCAEHANKGKDVCGVCVSSLYTTID